MQLGYSQLETTCSQLGTSCTSVVYHYDRAYPAVYVNQNAPAVDVNTAAPDMKISVVAPSPFVSQTSPKAVIHGAVPSASASKSTAPDATAFVYTFSPIISVDKGTVPAAFVGASSPTITIGLNAPSTSVSKSAPDATVN